MCMFHPTFAAPAAGQNECVVALILKILDLEEQLESAGKPVAGFLEAFDPLPARLRDSPMGKLAMEVRSHKKALLASARTLNSTPGVTLEELESKGFQLILCLLEGRLADTSSDKPPAKGCCCH